MLGITIDTRDGSRSSVVYRDLPSTSGRGTDFGDARAQASCDSENEREASARFRAFALLPRLGARAEIKANGIRRSGTVLDIKMTRGHTAKIRIVWGAVNGTEHDHWYDSRHVSWDWTSAASTFRVAVSPATRAERRLRLACEDGLAAASLRSQHMTLTAALFCCTACGLIRPTRPRYGEATPWECTRSPSWNRGPKRHKVLHIIPRGLAGVVGCTSDDPALDYQVCKRP